MHCVYIDDCDIWHAGEIENLRLLSGVRCGCLGLGLGLLAFALSCVFEEHTVLGKQGQECLLSLINNSNVGNVEKKIWHRGAHFPGCYFAAGKGHVDQPSPGARVPSALPWPLGAGLTSWV